MSTPATGGAARSPEVLRRRVVTRGRESRGKEGVRSQEDRSRAALLLSGRPWEHCRRVSSDEFGMQDWSELENRLGVRFKDRRLLQQALVHSSHINENPNDGLHSNERLEFLGDAALGLIVGQDLYSSLPNHGEGPLTELRASIVRRDALARAAERIGLGDYLLLGRGEDAAGGRRRPSNLAAAFEAVVGAALLDSGLTAARRLARKSLAPELAASRSGQVPIDPKSRLQALVQARGRSLPAYRTLQVEGPDHSRRFTVEVSVNGDVLGLGNGSTKQRAEREAARVALEKMEG